MKLEQIADIRVGVPLGRKKVAPESLKKVKYKQIYLSCLSEVGVFDHSMVKVFEAGDEIEERYFSKVDDIIVRLREPVIAYRIMDKEKGLLIPSYFAVIRIKEIKTILPGYVTAVINSIKGQRYFQKFIMGSSVTMLNSRVLKEFDIEKLSLKKQRMLQNLIELKKKESDLLNELKEEKEKMYRYIENKIIEQGE